jgi:hypothetical protein
MRRLLKILLVVLVLLAAAGVVAYHAWWKRPAPLRLPDYALEVALPSGEKAALGPSPLRAGAAAVDITPEVGPGKPPVWMGGFSIGRSAVGVHDPLWARAIVLDDGRVRVALVALDLVGMHQDETARIRRALPASLGVDYVAICCTHNHEGPDTLGIWGRTPLESGVDPNYLARVRDAAIDAVRQSVHALAPARLLAAEADTSADELIRDSRAPRVIDPRLTALRFEARGEGDAAAPPRALATLLVWSNHPEAVGSENRLISSDFPHHVRAAVERDGGGTCIYLSGSVGGLMTPLEQAVRGLDGKTYDGDTFEKAGALGEVLARRAREALLGPAARREDAPAIAVRARLLDVPAENAIFWAAMKLGVLDRGMTAEGRVRTEVGALRVGPVALALVPGEIYPEIVVGGVESPEGADFPGAPVETPPLRKALLAVPGAALAGVVGLANDEVGYLVPRTQWDARAPHAYGLREAPYGEINSLGPLAAGEVHGALRRAIGELPR